MPYTIDKSIIVLEYNPLIIDLLLLVLFGVQHSVMARAFFKNNLLSKLSDTFKSATYCIASALCLVAIVYFWQPIDGYLWKFEDGVMFWIFTTLYVLGWSFAFISTFLIDHFELFGLHQGYRVLKNLPEPPLKFQVRYFYKFVRHPIQLGTLIGLVATPSMSYGHLLLSIGMLIYVLIGLYFEEKDLLKTFGQEYLEYKKTTPMLIPFIHSRR
ncbi:methyltransferase family protein [Sulfurimonas sp.]